MIVPPCATLEFKALGRRIADTRTLGFLTKLALVAELEILVAEAKEVHAAGRPAERVADMRRKYDAMIDKVAGKIAAGGDAQLAGDMRCNRERAWNEILEKLD